MSKCPSIPSLYVCDIIKTFKAHQYLDLFVHLLHERLHEKFPFIELHYPQDKNGKNPNVSG